MEFTFFKTGHDKESKVQQVMYKQFLVKNKNKLNIIYIYIIIIP